MPITISGSTGIAGVDGSASTPAVQGTDTNTGIVFPAADTVAVATGGTERMRVDSSGNVGIGTSSPTTKLDVVGNANFGSAIVTGTGVSTGDAQIELGGNRTGNGNSYIDFHSAASTDYETRILRGSGANGALVFDNAGTGAFYIQQLGAAPLIFSTNSTERARIDSSGNFLFNSGYGSVATAYGCRAWVNFNGTGTVAIRSSGNVTSITDNGTGDYTVNFTNAMPDANYSSVGACAKNDGNNDGNQTAQVGGYSGALQTASACRIRTVYITGFAAQDSPQVTFAAFR
jgi:hypothetical protein